MSESILTGSPPPADEPAEQLPDLVAAAVAACPAVASLSGGRFGEVATYLPGRRVVGVRMDEFEVAVHVVARWGFPMSAVADQVRAACMPLVAPRSINVGIDDLEIPGEAPDRRPADAASDN